MLKRRQCPASCQDLAGANGVVCLMAFMATAIIDPTSESTGRQNERVVGLASHRIW
jgi:hypothetical protein